MAPHDPERTYTELLFASSRKYAAWDPEVEVRVGDYGYITRGARAPWLKFWARDRRQGVFLKEGNIYDNGRAKKFDVPPPKTYEHEGSTGVSWVVSQNAAETDFSADVSAQTPALANCGIKSSFKFHSGQGAVLSMNGDSITTIDPPGALRPLLDDSTLPEGTVIVSEVHATSSYARYLGTPEVRQVSIGLNVAPPAVADVVKADVSAQWLRSTTIGNFKSKVNPDNKRTYYPLFRLVALEGDAVSNGLRAGIDNEMEIPLPDAVPPWLKSGSDKAGEEQRSWNLVRYFSSRRR
ncbi:hypothetical protein PENSPDRAFT_580121 [Peniophora sp. CONT]|nr:hypothetical protein PENSPDRAFT_580121 [Peniophora sp. CONT]